MEPRILIPKFQRKFFSGEWKRMRCYHSGDRNRNDVVATNIAITGHVKLGHLDEARKLFDEMPRRTVVSWNAMLSGYSRRGRFEEASELSHKMHRDGVRFTDTTLSCILSVCANSREIHHGKQLHSLVLKSGSESFDLVGSALLYFYTNCCRIAEAIRVFEELHQRNELLWNVMLAGYVKCNLMEEASRLFWNMPRQDVVAWTTMISGYTKKEHECMKALELFKTMREAGEVLPNEFCFDSAMRACCKLGALQEGRRVHAILLKYGFESDESIQSALIEFYCECEKFDDARSVYERINRPSLNTSNSLLNCLVIKEKIEEAEEIFNNLDEINAISCNLMIKGYASSGRIEDSIRLFEKMPYKTIISSNTMITAYFRNREIEKGMKLFEETKEERDPVTWNSVISGYTLNEKYEEALGIFGEMHRRSIEQTRSTYSVLLHACSCLSSLTQGRMIHSHIAKTPLESNVYVGTSLTDMYSKCGNINDAERSFSLISSPNVAAWTALINGYAQYGFQHKAISVFNDMVGQGIRPNAATLLSILSSCVHAGDIYEGLRLFCSMEEIYGIKPSIEHYTCIVDLLGRVGSFEKVADFVDQMDVKPDRVFRGALINVSRASGHIETAKREAEKILKAEPKTVSTYVMLSNMFGDVGKWEEKTNMRNGLICLDMKKDPGCSWIEITGKVHTFIAGKKRNDVLNSESIVRTIHYLTANLRNCPNQL